MYVFMFYDNFKLFFYLLCIFEVFLLDMIYILVFNLFIGNDNLCIVKVWVLIIY